MTSVYPSSAIRLLQNESGFISEPDRSPVLKGPCPMCWGPLRFVPTIFMLQYHGPHRSSYYDSSISQTVVYVLILDYVLSRNCRGCSGCCGKSFHQMSLAEEAVLGYSHYPVLIGSGTVICRTILTVSFPKARYCAL